MKDKLQHEKDYVAFLERRLKSAHYKANVSPEEYEKTEAKLKKARLVLRMLEKWFKTVMVVGDHKTVKPVGRQHGAMV